MLARCQKKGSLIRSEGCEFLLFRTGATVENGQEQQSQAGDREMLSEMFHGMFDF
jgi:hypothetical protein